MNKCQCYRTLNDGNSASSIVNELMRGVTKTSRGDILDAHFEVGVDFLNKLKEENAKELDMIGKYTLVEEPRRYVKQAHRGCLPIAILMGLPVMLAQDEWLYDSVGLHWYSDCNDKTSASRRYALNTDIKRVAFNGRYTVVQWEDRIVTIVKAQEGEKMDYEKGLAMAIAKRAFGNRGSYYEVFKKFLPESAKGDEK